MDHAGDFERGGGNQEAEDTHYRHAGTSDGRSNRQTEADQHGPGNVLGQVRDDGPSPNRSPNPALSRSRMASIAIPSRIASQATPQRGPKVRGRGRRGPAGSARRYASLLSRRSPNALSPDEELYRAVLLTGRADHQAISNGLFYAMRFQSLHAHIVAPLV